MAGIRDGCSTHTAVGSGRLGAVSPLQPVVVDADRLKLELHRPHDHPDVLDHARFGSRLIARASRAAPPPLLLRIARGQPQLPQAPPDHLYQVEWPVSPVGRRCTMTETREITPYLWVHPDKE